MLVQKEDFNNFEKKLEARVTWVICIVGCYNFLKVAIIVVLLLLDTRAPGFITVMLICDSVSMVILFAYFFAVIIIMQMWTYRRFRYEFNRHQVFMVTVSVAMLFCLPLNCYEMIFWLEHLNEDSQEQSY